MRVREYSRFDILGKIEKERLQRGWSEYQLAIKSDIPQSTISTWYRLKLQPSVSSIEHICDGLGITLAEFFEEADDYKKNDSSELLDIYNRLKPRQRNMLLSFLRTII